MGTVNFSVPCDVKKAFNEAFEGENKSAILTQLMRQAVEARAAEAAGGGNRGATQAAAPDETRA